MTKVVTVQSQQRWEYCFEARRTEAALLIQFNELGQQGWELVNAICYKDPKGIVAWGGYLKRPSATQAVQSGQPDAAAAHATPANHPADKPDPSRGFDLTGDEFKLKTE